MTNLEQWLEANDQYLTMALSWLRERLERLAIPERPLDVVTDKVSLPVQVELAADKRRWFERRRKLEHQVESVPVLLPLSEAGQGGMEEKGSVPLPEAMIAAEAAKPPPALIMLSRRLGLSDFERYTLLLCAAMELDTRIGGLCAHARQDPVRPFPTFALVLSLFDQPEWAIMSPERPLRYWRLIEINQPGAQPLVTSALKADERIVNYLKGLNYLDDRLTALVMPMAYDDTPLPSSQHTVAETLVHHLQRSNGRGHPPVFQLLGPDGQSKRMIAQHAVACLGLTLYRLAAEALPTQTAEHETFVRLWQRESTLLPIALYVDAAQLDRTGAQSSAIQRLFSRGVGVAFFDTREPWPDLSGDPISLDIAKPTPAEQRTAWEAALGERGGDNPARLAGQFSFNAPTIHAIAAHALTMSEPDDIKGALWTECLRHARPTLDQLAQALEPKATWRHLELPAPEKTLLTQIADQVRHRMAVYDEWGFRERMNRGLGLSVLFAGDSGTGKTMAAEVIANELGLLLYRIDLSAVVNKYIGETEKNLRRLFDAAEDGGAILFFDEADALFGKRSEVKDSHDRYANIEVNYLLQRMEAYRGLAILATNMKSALDQAFLRRLRFIVNFPFPGQAERLAIWRSVFPPQTPVEELDFPRLARLNLTGGSIHNIALNAAFLAARAGTPVTMPLVLDAARNEFRKLEKPINEADFRLLEAVGKKTMNDNVKETT